MKKISSLSQCFVGFVLMASISNFFLSRRHFSKTSVEHLTQTVNNETKILMVICHDAEKNLDWPYKIFGQNDQQVQVIPKGIKVTSASQSIEGLCYHSYAKAMIELREKENIYKPDDIVVFMKDKDSGSKQVSKSELIDRIIEAKKLGFVCFQKEFEYHWTEAFLLSSNEDINPLVLPEHPYFRQWSLIMEIEVPYPVTRCCYGGEFVTKLSSILSLRSTLLKNLAAPFKNMNDHFFSYFVERAWAILLAEKPTDTAKRYLLSKPHHINYDFSLPRRNYFGAFNFTMDLNEDTTENLSVTNKITLHGDPKIWLVMSYCKSDLSWFDAALTDVGFSGIDIISKCGGDKENLPKHDLLLYWPNIGRCDHTYARWILTEFPKKKQYFHEDDIIIFMKDSIEFSDAYSTKTFREVIDITKLTGFSCRQVVSSLDDVDYARGKEIALFSMHKYETTNNRRSRGYRNDQKDFKSNYENFRRWLAHVNVELADFTRVCYGGIFATKVSNILDLSLDSMQLIEESLSRGNNIEEAHFTERVWAALLAKEGSKEELNYLRRGRMTKKGINYTEILLDKYFGDEWSKPKEGKEFRFTTDFIKKAKHNYPSLTENLH